MEVSSSALYSYLMDDLYGSDHSARAFLQCSETDDFFPGATVQDVARLRLARSIFKKLIDVTSADADDRCLEKFMASNIRCRDWQLDCRGAWEEELVGDTISIISDFLHPRGEPLIHSLFDICRLARTGPGASLGASGVNFYAKLFSSRLTATSPEVYKLYLEYITWFTDWRNAEFDRLLAFGLPRYTLSSRLSFVRKTTRISRSICTEPSLNMFFQLGLGEIISKRLNQFFGIDLAAQPDRNRSLAFRGSISDLIATIDLESASDSLSCGVCGLILPEWFNDILDVLRTPNTSVRDQEVALHMISTMGNGFTFPLQTLIFASAVCATFRSFGLPFGRCDAEIPSWGVFGDDIALPSFMVDRLTRLLTLLGFRVNMHKSYSVGPFRESCGVDFYKGVNVRGVYLKTLRTQESRYVAINLLNEWSVRHSIPLRRTIGYLVDSVRYLAVPPFASPDSGIRVPEDVIRGLGFWKASKQRYLYRCREVRMPFATIEESGRIVPPTSHRKARKWVTNPSGLVYSFIGGYIDNMKIPIALKQGEGPTYRTMVRVSPYWGPSPEQVRSHGPAFWRRWKSDTSDLLGQES